MSAKNWKLVNCIKIDVKKDLLGVIPEKYDNRQRPDQRDTKV